MAHKQLHHSLTHSVQSVKMMMILKIRHSSNTDIDPVPTLMGGDMKSSYNIYARPVRESNK